MSVSKGDKVVVTFPAADGLLRCREAVGVVTDVWPKCVRVEFARGNYTHAALDRVQKYMQWCREQRMARSP